MPNNKKDRHQAIQDAAFAIVRNFGVKRLDDLPQRIRLAHLREFAGQLQQETDCHRETARIHIAKACRRLRHPDMTEEKAWGGMRPGGFGRNEKA